jgi:tungstate transport system ATP-binding protein
VADLDPPRLDPGAAVGLTPVPVVALAGITVRSPPALVLDVPALAIEDRGLLAIIGPNGAGKSTLLRVIGLLEAPSAGEVRFRGSVVTASRRLDVRRRMAMVFQEPLLADTSVFDNVALGLRFRGVPTAERRPRVTRWLERFGIADLASRRPRTLSGGEAQRCALARALVLGPEVLLLDEPFAALDPPTREALIADLGAILRREGVTTVLVTHDRTEARALADRVAVMMRGRIVQIDTPERLFRAPVSDEVARFVGVETIVDGRVTACAGGIAVVEIGGQRVEVAAEAAVGERVRLCLRPEDVILAPGAAALPAQSARNRLGGTVVQVVAAGAHSRVVVDCGFPLVALVTRRSLEDLALAEGVRVTAAFKATAPHLIRIA